MTRRMTAVEVVVGSTTTGRGTLRCKWTQRSLRYRFGECVAAGQSVAKQGGGWALDRKAAPQCGGMVRS